MLSGRCFIPTLHMKLHRSKSLQLEYPVSETDDQDAERKSMNKKIFLSPK